jgi:hypothetical protein
MKLKTNTTITGSVPQSQDVRNEFINGMGTAEERIERLVPLFFSEEWRNENPNYTKNIPKTTETVFNETLNKQIKVAASAPATCDRLKKHNPSNIGNSGD